MAVVGLLPLLGVLMAKPKFFLEGLLPSVNLGLPGSNSFIFLLKSGCFESS
jgi:hypothetical protein